MKTNTNRNARPQYKLVYKPTGFVVAKDTLSRCLKRPEAVLPNYVVVLA